VVAGRRGSRVMRKREPHWQSAEDRARVAAELIEEAESLTETGGIATPAEVKRSTLPPPLRVALPAPEPLRPEVAAREAASRGDQDGALALLDAAIAAAPDDPVLLRERAMLL